jgi:hypothetical protein
MNTRDKANFMLLKTIVHIEIMLSFAVPSFCLIKVVHLI